MRVEIVQGEICKVVRAHWAEHSTGPTYAHLSRALQMDDRAVRRHLLEMERQGLIHLVPRAWRGISVIEPIADKREMLDESELELLLYEQILQARLPRPAWQYRIEGHRVDFTFLVQRVLCEVQGGTGGFGKGRGSHAREPQYSKDRRFSNLCQGKGWRVLEFSAPMINSGESLETIKDHLRQRGAII